MDAESNRHIAVEAADAFGFHDGIRFKVKRGGRGRCRDTGEWVHREMTAGHEKDWYKEIITDPRTGRVVHRCEEPLSQHWGRGTAKESNNQTAGPNLRHKHNSANPAQTFRCWKNFEKKRAVNERSGDSTGHGQSRRTVPWIPRRPANL